MATTNSSSGPWKDHRPDFVKKVRLAQPSARAHPPARNQMGFGLKRKASKPYLYPSQTIVKINAVLHNFALWK
jgi:hypothetical protein